MRTLCFLLLAACTGATPDDTGPTFDPDPPDELASATRPAGVVLPGEYDISQTYPLVISLHGFTANATVQDVIFGLGVRAEETGFILVKPEGTTDSQGRQFWNANSECCDFEDSGVDDVAYITGLIEEAKTLYPVSHVAIVGHSNGGYMSYRMACERGDLIDRIAPLAGTVSPIASECPADEFVSVLHMHGTADTSVDYETTANHLGARDSIAFWSELGGCTGPTDEGTRDHLGNPDGAETDVERWSCPDGVLELWTSNEGDHTYLSANSDYKDDLAAWLTAE